ncbi:response regulator [Paraburkholderia sp. 40]|uniref:response regulator n=1 Tax=Paraburkholderia sp. 40 TaxID=2991059 RepID=UPI003D237863
MPSRSPSSQQLPTPVIGTVWIIDDDESSRLAIESLVQSIGYSTQVFSLAADYLAARTSHLRTENGVLISDIRIPGMSGLELLDRLVVLGAAPPTIFVSAAVALLDKPVDAVALKRELAMNVRRFRNGWPMIAMLILALLIFFADTVGDVEIAWQRATSGMRTRDASLGIVQVTPMFEEPSHGRECLCKSNGREWKGRSEREARYARISFAGQQHRTRSGSPPMGSDEHMMTCAVDVRVREQ